MKELVSHLSQSFHLYHANEFNWIEMGAGLNINVSVYAATIIGICVPMQYIGLPMQNESCSSNRGHTTRGIRPTKCLFVRLQMIFRHRYHNKICIYIANNSAIKFN